MAFNGTKSHLSSGRHGQYDYRFRSEFVYVTSLVSFKRILLPNLVQHYASNQRQNGQTTRSYIRIWHSPCTGLTVLWTWKVHLTSMLWWQQKRFTWAADSTVWPDREYRLDSIFTTASIVKEKQTMYYPTIDCLEIAKIFLIYANACVLWSTQYLDCKISVI